MNAKLLGSKSWIGLCHDCGYFGSIDKQEWRLLIFVLTIAAPSSADLFEKLFNSLCWTRKIFVLPMSTRTSRPWFSQGRSGLASKSEMTCLFLLLPKMASHQTHHPRVNTKPGAPRTNLPPSGTNLTPTRWSWMWTALRTMPKTCATNMGCRAIPPWSTSAQRPRRTAMSMRMHVISRRVRLGAKRYMPHGQAKYVMMWYATGKCCPFFFEMMNVEELNQQKKDEKSRGLSQLPLASHYWRTQSPMDYHHVPNLKQTPTI